MSYQPTIPQPVNSSTSSLSSSFSSSAASSMLPDPRSNSSQSDLASEHSVEPSPSSSPCTQPHSSSRSPYSSSMGVTQSQLAPSPSPSTNKLASRGAALGQAAAVTGSKLRRALVIRRKKGDEVSRSPPSLDTEKRKQGPSSQASPIELSPRSTSGPKQLAFQFGSTVFGKKAVKSSLTPPPVPPPKPTNLRSANKQTLDPVKTLQVQQCDNRSSMMAVSPGMTSALAYMQLVEEKKDPVQTSPVARPPRLGESDVVETKEAWRKSDSTMNTIRPGGSIGAKNSRPVSMAESLQSNHTVVPVNKRLSALITDADFAMPEEDPAQSNLSLVDSEAAPRKSPSLSSLKAKNRRSLSLNVSKPPAPKALPPAPSPPNTNADGVNITRISSDTPTLTRTAANGIISPSSTGSQSTGSSIRGRLAAWTATTGLANSDIRMRRTDHHPSNFASTPATRHPAITITNTFTPAAGLAKRAVEKMGRAWGGLNASSSSLGQSSSSSTPPSSYSSTTDHGLSRTTSNQSGAGSSGKSRRRTPNAPSGSWSIRSSSTTSASLSDSDAFPAPVGPNLGKLLRAPIHQGQGGIVFGHDLRACTSLTIVEEHLRGPGQPCSRDLSHLESRHLCALALRCAQHLMIWGLQEEGLFRVSGRPSHVSKLRAEFDTGADYDLSLCSPGDLDPHAVSSVFKAYLRELPEPILTYALQPSFEAALAAENEEANSRETNSRTSTARTSSKGPGLPQSPRGIAQVIRKPPSLSTLAMPSFSGIRPPSQKLLHTIQSIIIRLPEENRDLLHTVVDLIRATAKECKETKMPLSNLLLVFCPSLNMNPSLLRVLCDNDSIWDEPAAVLDIKQDDAVIDISHNRFSHNPDESEISTRSSEDLDRVHDPSLGRLRPLGQRRGAIQTVYLADEDEDEEDEDLSSSEDSNPETSVLDIENQEVVDHGAGGNTSNVHTEPISSTASSSKHSLETASQSPIRRLPSLSNLLGGRGKMSFPNGSGSLRNRRPTISSPISYPVQFPITSSVPTTPISTPISPRRSMPLLSLPSLSVLNRMDSDRPAHLVARSRLTNSPSIRLKFSKKSSDRFAAPQTPSLTPLSSNASSYTLPLPKVDTTRLTLGYGLNIDSEGAPEPLKRRSASDGQVLESLGAERDVPHSSTEAFVTAPSSQLSLINPSGTIPRYPPTRINARRPQTVHSTSEMSLLPEPERAIEEDWTQSVLLDMSTMMMD